MLGRPPSASALLDKYTRLALVVDEVINEVGGVSKRKRNIKNKVDRQENGKEEGFRLGGLDASEGRWLFCYTRPRTAAAVRYPL